MAGYTRQSAADIVPTAVVRATPINNEFNAIRDAFDVTNGHQHDGSTGGGAFVSAVADPDGNNKLFIDTANNRVGINVEVSFAPENQVFFTNGAILPAVNNDLNLGSATYKFKDIYAQGTTTVTSLIASTATISGGSINSTSIGATTPAAVTATSLNVNSGAVINTADINGGTIDGAVIGGAAAQAITGTLVTATTGFAGPLTGNVTGNTAGTHTGAVVGDVAGNLTGNVTAATGSSSFNNVTINGGLDMNAGTTATITNLTAPTASGDAATKGYVDAADALKLNKAGDAMTGALAMGTNKITGLGTPTVSTDAATKGYVDTSVAAVVAAAPAALDTLNELATALGDDANFSTTVTNSIATKLPLAGGTMTGAVEMSTNKLTGVGNPTLAQDAATKSYVDAADATKLALAGGTMTGAVAMGGNKITGLGTPTTTQDATTKSYVDAADALKLNLSGGTMSGAVAMGGNKITNLADPTVATDAVSRNYVDVLYGTTVSAATSASAAATSASDASGFAGAAEGYRDQTLGYRDQTLGYRNEAEGFKTNASGFADNAAASAILAASYTPTQTGNAGKYLTTDGSVTSWGDVDALPDQTGNAGKYLKTDGTTATWEAASGGGATATRTVTNLVATEGQTVFTPTNGYTVYNVDVYLNGVLLQTSDFTATNGTTITLATAASLGDEFVSVAWEVFETIDIPLRFSFFKSNGVSDQISLVSINELPFFDYSSVSNNITVTT